MEVLVQHDVPAAMRDGTTLMANAYRPAEGGPYPVLLTRTPYGKDTGYDATYLDPVRAARAGYVVVIQDVRGRYASGGKFVPFVNEFEDGYDTVEWAAGLPGSDGQVGMFGESYFGKTQWQAAAMGPPSLASMVPGITWGNHLNGAQMRGGAQELGTILYWGRATISLNALFHKHRDDPETIRERLPEIVGLVDAVLSGEGYDVFPLSKLPDPGDVVPFVRGGFARGVDDASWAYVGMDDKYGAVEAPTFHIGGWYDVFIGETLRQYASMKELALGRGTSPPRLLVGPWVHGRYDSTVGDLDFGVGASGRFLNYRGDMTDKHLRWFDATLKGDEAALEGTPPVEVFVMGENRWRGYEEWPPPGAREEAWHLRAEGALSREAPSEDEAADGYAYDPRDPVPTIGGATLLSPVFRPGPRDQRPNEERPDVLVYTGGVLDGPYTALGPVNATLFAASSAPDTDFVVRLVDVHPDGRAIVVADGVVRASARESYPAPGTIRPTKPSPIEPGEVYEYSVDMWATGITFLAGHRVRVEVTSSSFPRWDRNPNTGEGGFDAGRTEVARQTVFHDPNRPSRVTLTVVDG